MNKFVLALDQGTTSSRAIVFDRNGQIISMAQKEFTQVFPQPGWVEHDPLEIWSSQAGVALEALTKKGIDASQLVAIGITNQRETTVVWNKLTGNPVYNAIVWQDRRTATYCDQLKAEGAGKYIQEKTGLIIDAYFSASKLKWILDNVEGARSLANKGELAFGTIDSWLLWKLSKGRTHATDISNASRTMLFNIHTLCWDSELLSLFNIPLNILPEVRSSSEVYTEALEGLSLQVPVAGIAGDQQAALFGQMCTKPGMVKNTYGTGCFMMMNTGLKPIDSKQKLLTTIAWKIGSETSYALEGSVFNAGSVVQWLRDGLGIIRNSSEIEELASQVNDSAGVYFVPAFAGLGAPYWNQHARGLIVGLTRGSKASHIARAAIESIAFQTYDILQAMRADSEIPILELRVDGGATVNNLLMQFQCDLLGSSVVRPKITETTALGAAYLAGLAVNYWKNIEEIENQWQQDRVFKPSIETELKSAMIGGWNRAIHSSLSWANYSNGI
jgi:glycerol kinase